MCFHFLGCPIFRQTHLEFALHFPLHFQGVNPLECWRALRRTRVGAVCIVAQADQTKEIRNLC